jgi:hypothetical protein
MQIIADSFRPMSDEQLLSEVQVLVARERAATNLVIASLAEVERRGLHVTLGHSSMLAYCMRVLHMSKSAALNRIHAARTARAFPRAFEYLNDGSLTISNLNVLGRHLNVNNHEDLLRAALYKTKEEVEELVAPAGGGPNLVTIHVRVRPETRGKLHHAQALLRHVLPDGNTGDIIDRALTLLITDLEKRKFAKVHRPRRAAKATLRSRHIPAAVRRAVAQRDEGRCAFVGDHGRCDETAFLEYHHVVPYARGGPSTVENLQLRCGAHNQYEAELEFGPGAHRDSPRAAGGPPG